MIGTTVSHYRILEKLGEGGMGIVYKAQDTKLDRLIALKFLPPHLAANPADKARFIHEAKAASALDHLNICTVHEIDETPDHQLFIVMPYYEGETLKEKIARGPLQLNETIDITLQIANGLAKAHARHITHRDIKPGNVIVTSDGIAKIVDFGLAKLAGMTKVTRTGATVGTIAYMSPEQAQGNLIDHRSDIWSLGVTMYEMLTGRLPFSSDYEQAVVYKVLNEDPESVTRLRPELPASVDRVVEKALEKNPEKRYQHADEMAVELESLKKEVEAGISKQRLIRLKIPRKQRPYVYGVTGVLLVAVVAVRLFLFTGVTETIDSIAVLPLKNLSGDREQEYFVEGMHEALITELSKISALKVISRTSTMRYKQTDKPMPQVARELNVDGVIEGSVLREGEQVRITVQLIHGASDHHLWAESYQRELRGILALHSEVAQAIANEIKVKLTPQEQVRLAAARAVNPKAYELYVLGRHHWNQRTIQAQRQAVESFRNALEEDPGYAPAYAALADAYILLGEQGGLPQKEARSLAETAIRKALELDENLAEGHASLGQWKLHYEWNWAEAEQGFKRSIELNPGYAAAHQLYGRSLGFAGRFEEAISKLQRARELDPLSITINAYIGQIYLYARQYDRAAEQLQKTLEINPNHALIRHNLGELYLAQGRFAQAVGELEESVELSGEPSSHYLAMLGCAYARANRKQAAAKILNQLNLRSKQGLVSAFDMASLYTALGEDERALAWLEQGYERRDGWLVELKAWPWFDSLRSDPRFQDLLRRMNFPTNES